MEYNELECALEAVLFASGDSVPADKLCTVLGVDPEELAETAKKLADYYDYNRRGIRLIQLEDRYQLCSRADFAPLVRNVLESRRPQSLTQAALEVLAVVAYKQPITKTYIEQVRGVDCSYTVSSLCDKNLIEECGRLDVPGRPILYRTTENFLRSFGIADLQELPEILNEEGEAEQLTLPMEGEGQ